MTNTQQEEWVERFDLTSLELGLDGEQMDELREVVRQSLLQARKEAREEAEKQCEANCDANYNMGYAKGIATHVNVDLIKQEAREELSGTTMRCANCKFIFAAEVHAGVILQSNKCPKCDSNAFVSYDFVKNIQQEAYKEGWEKGKKLDYWKEPYQEVIKETREETLNECISAIQQAVNKNGMDVEILGLAVPVRDIFQEITKLKEL